jgi:hypothetical protein
MKTSFHASRKSQRGLFELDLAIALVILTVAILPLGLSFARERQALHADYCRAVANEIVDGEMEVLVAGDWKNYPDGAQTYTIHSRAVANLPDGRFELTKTGNHLRLEWTPAKREGIGVVIRETTLP